MAYEWTTGETITAAKLNATGGGVLIVGDSDGTLDKTWQEITDSPFAILKSGSESEHVTSFLVSYGIDSGIYFVGFRNLGDSSNPVEWYVTDSSSGYPSYPSA